MSVGKAMRAIEQNHDEYQRLPTVGEIQTEVAAHFGVTRLDLISARRSHDLARARHVAMWLARHTTAHSLPAIGRYFGDRDHTTVMHAIQCVDRRRAGDDGLEAELRVLMKSLRLAHAKRLAQQ